MKTTAILILAIAIAPAFARPITSLNPRDITKEQQSIVRDHDPTKWTNMNTDVVNAHNMVNNEFHVRDISDELEARHFDDELEARDFNEEFEARYFADELGARDFYREPEAPSRGFNNELKARDYYAALERRGHHCPVCKKAPSNRCVKKGHIEKCTEHDVDVYHLPGRECETCKEIRLAAERAARDAAEEARRRGARRNN